MMLQASVSETDVSENSEVQVNWEKYMNLHELMAHGHNSVYNTGMTHTWHAYM